jgi:hypothetical protein
MNIFAFMGIKSRNFNKNENFYSYKELYDYVKR